MKSIRSWFWRLFIRRAALHKGFIDPVAVMSRLRRFAHTSEVSEPLELVRAGMIFHARGLLNTRAIQHNLDWVWPYWVERQFDPSDPAFVPRAFSLTHINLTHRNWTATGIPDCAAYPIVDPRGLVMPFFDGWSLDLWVVDEQGQGIFPSRVKEGVEQRWTRTGERLEVITETQTDRVRLHSAVTVEPGARRPECVIRYTADHEAPAWLVVALRPCNAEGISLVDEIALTDDRQGWRVNGDAVIRFDEPVERHFVSNYHEGDVVSKLPNGDEQAGGSCPTGMATAAACFRINARATRAVAVRVTLDADPAEPTAAREGSYPGWSSALSGTAAFSVPDERMCALYEQAIHSLVLMTPGDVFPGPYTYKRFWFRDASFVLNALLCAGASERVGRVLQRYPDRQRVTGYFHSQDGEWDSNGEALWIMDRYYAMCPGPLSQAHCTAIKRGAQWIARKRIKEGAEGPYAGLMPAGFSAEHLGPNDYYYWDNFWSVAGLRAAARLLAREGDATNARLYAEQADSYQERIEESLADAHTRLGRPAMPAAPTRRLDAGAIGSLAAGYPLQMMPADDARLLDTVAYLADEERVRGGFFQEMIHSGINAYLTLHMAQVWLRAGDPRYMELIRAVMDLATPTGQWPEAIHPQTGGGCMGDGHHVWASAEWAMMMRNLFVREEGDTLVIGGGIDPDWQQPGAHLHYGPGLTTFGRIHVQIDPHDTKIDVAWDADWHRAPQRILVALPGQESVSVDAGRSAVQLRRR